MVYTPDKLAEVTHEQGDRILLAILGEVYDVSKNPTYYGAHPCTAGLPCRDQRHTRLRSRPLQVLHTCVVR